MRLSSPELDVVTTTTTTTTTSKIDAVRRILLHGLKPGKVQS